MADSIEVQFRGNRLLGRILVVVGWMGQHRLLSRRIALRLIGAILRVIPQYRLGRSGRWKACTWRPEVFLRQRG